MAKKILQSFNPFVFALDEVRLPGGKTLPAVELPKARYAPGEVYIQGPRKGFHARPIVELSEAEQERIEASPQIMAMLARGVYRYIDHVPESMKSTEDLVAEQRAEIERLTASQKAPSDFYQDGANTVKAYNVRFSVPGEPVIDQEKVEMKAVIDRLVAENTALRTAPPQIVPDPDAETLRQTVAALQAENAALKADASTPHDGPTGPVPGASPYDALMEKTDTELGLIAEHFGVENFEGLSREDLVTAILAAGGTNEESAGQIDPA